MKTFIKTFFIVLLSIILYSCAMRVPIEKVTPQNNATYKVEYLFEHDGCKVYRFEDKGNYVYFTNCQGDVTSIKNDSTSTRVTNRVDLR